MITITLNETDLAKLADLYNRNEKRDAIHFDRLTKAREEKNASEIARMEKFRQVTEARERAYDDVLKILGLRVVTDESDPEGWYKVVKR
jgi:hypothetical protein